METAQVDRLVVEVARLSNMTRDVRDVLNAQQNVLKIRDIYLDEQMLRTLDMVYTRLEDIHEILLQRRPELAQLRAIVRTMSAINSTLDLNQILNSVMDAFIELTEAERGMIVLLDDDGAMHFSAVRGLDEQTINKSNFMVSRTVVQDVASQGEPIFTTNAQEDKRYNASESIISYAVRSIICVPLKVKNHVIGVAYADHRYRKELFGEQEVRSLVAFANQAAIAIENARLFDDVQKRLAEIIEIRNFLDSIFTSIISAVVTLDAEGVVMTANNAVKTILGIDPQASIGKPYTDIFPSLYEGFEELLEAVRLENRQQIIEINPVLADRGGVHLTLKLSPLIDTESHDTRGVTIVIDDQTEIKKNDETLRVVNTYLSEEMVSNIQSIDRLGLGGEDRIVTAVFADVRGFTTFSEQLEPETLMTIINQYLSISSDSIQAYQGVIDKFMGDAIVGLFNTQLNPQDDHAVRAVRAAVKMIKDVKALHETLPPTQRLWYGIGVHTGPVTVGNVGSPSRKEFTAIGEAVVQAKKLEGGAQGGEILVSAETYDLIKDQIECEFIERQLRGEAKFRQMYKVVGTDA